MSRVCSKCGTEKSLDLFAKRSDRKNQIRSYCLSCDNDRRKELYNKKKDYEQEQSKIRYLKNRNKNLRNMRNYHIQKRYGITEEIYNQLLEKQNHSCFVCLKHVSILNKKLHIDHDAITGEIRGLLCGPCNRYFIGSQRTPDKFLRAIEYLNGPYTGLFVTDKDKND